MRSQIWVGCLTCKRGTRLSLHVEIPRSIPSPAARQNPPQSLSIFSNSEMSIWTVSKSLTRDLRSRRVSSQPRGNLRPRRLPRIYAGPNRRKTALLGPADVQGLILYRSINNVADTTENLHCLVMTNLATNREGKQLSARASDPRHIIAHSVTNQTTLKNWLSPRR
jgi:hypothetical protein